MSEMLKRIATEEDGQGLVEYGLIIAGVALVAIVAIWALGGKVTDLFNGLSFAGPAA